MNPTTCLIFLGIKVDSVASQLRLPADKLARVRQLISEWRGQKACRRKDLESLVGLLNHACNVVRSGSVLPQEDARPPLFPRPCQSWSTMICLNAGFRAGLAWWQEFLPLWNGISFLPPTFTLLAQSGTMDRFLRYMGQRGILARRQVPAQSLPLNIAEKELIPIILACDTWGRRWSGCQVLCNCDNQMVVACLHPRTSKLKVLMHLLRCLVFLEARHSLYLCPMYIPSAANHLADDLSRNNAVSFFLKVPSARSSPVPVSPQLLQALLDPQADWISSHWRNRFIDTSRQV